MGRCTGGWVRWVMVGCAGWVGVAGGSVHGGFGAGGSVQVGRCRWVGAGGSVQVGRCRWVDAGGSGQVGRCRLDVEGCQPRAVETSKAARRPRSRRRSRTKSENKVNRNRARIKVAQKRGK